MVLIDADDVGDDGIGRKAMTCVRNLCEEAVQAFRARYPRGVLKTGRWSRVAPAPGL